MTEDHAPSLAEVCVVACAEAWRGDGTLLASPMGLIPALGARLARLTFSPGLLLTDGEAYLLAPDPPGHHLPASTAPPGPAAHPGRAGTAPSGPPGHPGQASAAPPGPARLGQASTAPSGPPAHPGPDGAGPVIEGWLPYRLVFTMLAGGHRHVMMGASQLDRFGNQNISCIGDWARPRAQLLGVRGAPGNTINHPVSYWVPRHSPRVFVERADMVCGIGYDRAAGLGGTAGRFHELRVVVTNLAVLDFATPDHTMRLRSVHPGVRVEDVIAATGFPLAVPAEVPVTRLPTPDELALIRGRLDPAGWRDAELPAPRDTG